MIRIVVLAHGADVSGVAPGRALRDAGHEVIHAGTQDRVPVAVACVVQEDADLVVVALGGVGPSAHPRAFLDDLRAALDAAGAGDVPVLEVHESADTGVLVAEVAAATGERPSDKSG